MLEQAISKYLFPHYVKKIGFISLILGVVCLYLRFVSGIKPDYLEVKVFAFYSSFFNTTYFSFVGNNISEEIGLFFTGIGFFLITLSCESVENKRIWEFRLKSFIFSIYVYAILFLIFVFFFYGWGFMAFMGASLFLQLIGYNIIFSFLLFRYKDTDD